MQSVLWAYLKKHIKLIGLLVVYSVIFSVVMHLHNIETSAVLYAFLLSTFFTVVFFTFGFWRYYKRHRILTQMRPHVALTIDDLPEPTELMEQDYQALVRQLYSEVQQKITQIDFAQSQMNDYYTLWVHQIKTPIAALQLLLEAYPQEQTLSMKTELFKIEQYVEMALNYIRLESETSDLRFEKQEIYELVKASIRKYRTLFIEKGIKLNFEPFSLEVVTDAKWFAFCFEQVLSNALKYTNGGEISIGTTQGESVDAPKRLVVADTGIGISPEDLPRVFERGFTGFNGRLDRKSTGLGLYLCRRALQRLSHDISVTSAPGTGTRVTLIFPPYKTVS